MKITALVCLVALASATGCSSAEPKASSSSRSAAAPTTDTVVSIPQDTVVSITKDETWSGSSRIGGQITIEAGVTVTIAPGATIAVGTGALITVKGKIVADAAASPTTLTSDRWVGFVVVEGGSLALSGITLENASAALDVQAGSAKFDDGVISWSSTPFRVLDPGTLTMTRSNVVKAQGLARVKGKYTASHVDFDTTADSGIVIDAQGASASIEDTTLHGQGAPTDLIVVAAGSLHLAYSDLSGAHCGLHFWNVNQVDVSNVTIHDTSFGAMLYGSHGTNLSIENSNFERSIEMAIEETDGSVNDALTVSGCYFGENTIDARLQATSNISITNKASAPLTNAKPR